MKDKCVHTFLFIFFFLFCPTLMATQANGNEIGGKLSSNGQTTSLDLQISQKAPSSIVVELLFQPGVRIISVSPATKKIQQNRGLIKWHIKNPSPPGIRLVVKFDKQVPPATLRAKVQFKSQVSGNIQQLVFTPR